MFEPREVVFDDDETSTSPLPMAYVESSSPEQELEQRVVSLAGEVTALKVVDEISHESACEHLKSIKSMRAEIDRQFEKPIKKAREAWQELIDWKKTFTERLDAAEIHDKGEIARWQIERERKAEEERIRLEAQQRAEQEATRAKQIQEAEAAGAFEEAEAIAEAPVVLPPAPVVSAPKVKGVAMRKRKVVVVRDAAKLAIAVAHKLQNPALAGPPLAIVEFSQQELNKYASVAHEWPGCEVREVASVAASRRG